MRFTNNGLGDYIGYGLGAPPAASSKDSYSYTCTQADIDKEQSATPMKVFFVANKGKGGTFHTLGKTKLTGSGGSAFVYDSIAQVPRGSATTGMACSVIWTDHLGKKRLLVSPSGASWQFATRTTKYTGTRTSPTGASVLELASHKKGADWFDSVSDLKISAVKPSSAITPRKESGDTGLSTPSKVGGVVALIGLVVFIWVLTMPKGK